MDALSIEQSTRVELVLAHIYVLQVKREIARGLHTGARGKQVSWDSAGDMRATQVALISKAFNHECPGLLLNLLLDWNTGATLVSTPFLDNVCAKYLTDTASIRDSLDAGRRIYDLVISEAWVNRGSRTTGFIDALWAADNFEVAMRALAELQQLEGGVGDSIISSLAIQLMQCASMASNMPVASQIFDRYKPWLNRSPVAYNVLLHPKALAYDIPGVVAIPKRMRTNDVYPDAVTWTTIMSGICLNSRIEAAMKLFALHLDFLPQRRSNDVLSNDDILYAPMRGFILDAPNLWQQWYANNTKPYSIYSYFANLLRGMAAQYQEPLASGRRSRRPTDSSMTVPWLPTLATHKMLLKHLGRAHHIQEITAYYALFKQHWPHQYSQWSGSKGRTGDDSGLRGIERLVRGYLAQNMSELRNVYGLGSAVCVSTSPYYYDYCERIQDLASKPCVLDSIAKSRPDRIVFNKSLVAYALNSDIRSILGLMEKHPELHDIATWTELVRCILTQIQASPGDARMLQPLASADWLTFILDLEQRLALRGIWFTQVTFGQITQSAVQRPDIIAVPRIVKYMSTNTSDRFNIGMSRMVLNLEYPFDLKCAFVKSTLGDSVGVRPDHKLLALVVRMARSKADVEGLPEIVDLFEQKYGIEQKYVDCDYLAELCMQLGAFDKLRYWIGARFARLKLLPNGTADSVAMI
ncbi:hypothetical protein GGI19_004911 [Coemansia pectinata]|uniref:Uncharacterized protein n=1 Tax=Coemansia pectinata TaxID=1052879 RepID=A0A9W8GT77_9FUNG|nr:hypothetical protein GGI19_004911 [Coemansia pectinata]